MAGGDDDEQGGADSRPVNFYVARNGDVALPEPKEDQVEAQHNDQYDYCGTEEPTPDETEEGEGKYVEVHALVEDRLHEGRYGAGGFVHLGEWAGIQVLEHRFPSTRSCRTDGGGRNDGGNGSGQSQRTSDGVVGCSGEGSGGVTPSEAEYKVYVGNQKHSEDSGAGKEQPYPRCQNRAEYGYVSKAVEPEPVGVDALAPGKPDDEEKD